MSEAPRRIRWMPRGNIRVISAANFLGGLYQNVLNVLLQPFVLSFGGGLTVLGLLQALASRIGGLVGSLVQPFGGYLADLRGRRRVAILGSGLVVTAMGLLVLAAQFRGQSSALAALVFPGFLCMALGLIAAPALQSAIAEFSDPGRRASAYATTIFFYVLPGALRAIPGGVIADRLGYAPVFGIALAFEAVNLLLFARFLRETAPAKVVHTWRERILQSLCPPREVRGMFLVSAMDALAWGLAAGIIFGLVSKEFGFSNTELALIGASWALSFALFLPPTAAFVNRFGPKRSILFSESLGIPIMLGWLLSSRVEHFALVSVLGGLTAATGSRGPDVPRELDDPGPEGGGRREPRRLPGPPELPRPVHRGRVVRRLRLLGSDHREPHRRGRGHPRDRVPPPGTAPGRGGGPEISTRVKGPTGPPPGWEHGGRRTRPREARAGAAPGACRIKALPRVPQTGVPETVCAPRRVPTRGSR